MSERPPVMLTLSTRNMSADASRVVPGGRVAAVETTREAALAALVAFTQIPSTELLEVDARAIFSGPRGKFSVQNVRGKLYATKVPEAENAAVECTPEEAIELFTSADPSAASAVAAAVAAEQADLIASVEQVQTGPRAWINSAWVITLLAVAVLVAGYMSFSPDTPPEIEIIRDPARTASLHTGFDGLYGQPNATVLKLDHGRLAGLVNGAAEGKVTFATNYRYGLRAEQVVIVVDNGSVLEPQPDRSLVFLESRYPRMGAK